MDRSTDDPAASAAERTVRPSEEHAELALREAAVLMAPLARWLLRHGVPYPAFADLLKSVFLEAAREEIVASGSKPTHSALSVLSGVHRKDVRALQEGAGTPPPRSSVPLPSLVFTRWLTDRRYRRADGTPKTLPRSGPGVSFESLARDTSNDVHPRTVLDELVRSGLAKVEGEEVVPLATSFVPSRKLDEMTSLFSANVSDHIAAAVHNLTLKGPKFLEQSVFADGLGAASIEHLHQCAREAWNAAFTTMVGEARERFAADRDLPENLRMRFGVYFYAEPAQPPNDGAVTETSAAPPSTPRSTRGRRKA